MLEAEFLIKAAGIVARELRGETARELPRADTNPGAIGGDGTTGRTATDAVGDDTGDARGDICRITDACPGVGAAFDWGRTFGSSVGQPSVQLPTASRTELSFEPSNVRRWDGGLGDLAGSGPLRGRVEDATGELVMTKCVVTGWCKALRMSCCGLLNGERARGCTGERNEIEGVTWGDATSRLHCICSTRVSILDFNSTDTGLYAALCTSMGVSPSMGAGTCSSCCCVCLTC